jgi:segregation and condensation protein B
MDDNEIKHFLEAALLAAGRPLNIDQLKALFDGRTAPEKAEIRTALTKLNEEYEGRGIVISEVASGFRMQVRASMADRLHKLWEERPPRYSRALFETLALIAYRQPITRGEIEEIRGVTVSSNITRQLLERDWVRVVGHRDVPGRPAMFGATKGFLDYFSLKKLDDLPPLADLADWESLRLQLNLPEVEGRDGSDDLDLELLESVAESVDETEDAVEDAADGNSEIVDAIEAAESDDDSNLPVLYPEGTEETAEAESDTESDGDEPPEEEQLAVAEWPEPVG